MTTIDPLSGKLLSMPAHRSVPPTASAPTASAPAADAPAADADGPAVPLSKLDFEALARFRAELRRYLRFSEDAIRANGLTPQQYQLLLAIKGFPGREWATVTELAEQLQLRHHSVVELIDRAQARELVDRRPHPTDARAVMVVLTGSGESILARLSELHRDHLAHLEADFLTVPFTHA